MAPFRGELPTYDTRPAKRPLRPADRSWRLHSRPCRNSLPRAGFPLCLVFRWYSDCFSIAAGRTVKPEYLCIQEGLLIVIIAKQSLCFAAIVWLGGAVLSHAGDTKRIEQDDKSITYTGNWYSNNASGNSGGNSALTNSLDAQATVSFTGSGITWIGVRDPYNGLATLYLDGTQYTVDTYGSTTQYQQPLFTVSGLGGGKHTLSIQIMHRRGVNAMGSWVWIDAFDIINGENVKGQVTASAGLVQQDDPAITYSGNWFRIANPAMSGGSAVESTDLPSSVTLTFDGDGVQWIGYRDSDSGIANVYLDGEKVATVDTYSATTLSQAVVYSIDNIKPGNGTHSVRIEVTGTHNSASTGSWVWVDGFQVSGKK